MKTAVTIGVCVAVAIAVVALVPAIKGPFNRAINTANEQLGQEYVVDNFKAEYVKLHKKRANVLSCLDKFRTEMKIAEKKLQYSSEKHARAKNVLVATGTADMNAFNRAKDAYETASAEVGNFEVMINTYSNAIAKLETTLNTINANMSRARANVATLESKKALVDSIKGVNKVIENIKGVGDSDIAVNVEKLDEDALRESIKLEALQESGKPMSKAEADAYLQSIK